MYTSFSQIIYSAQQLVSKHAFSIIYLYFVCLCFTVEAPRTSDNDDSDDEGLPEGAIVGILVGALLLVTAVLAVLLAVYLVTIRKNKMARVTKTPPEG